MPQQLRSITNPQRLACHLAEANTLRIRGDASLRSGSCSFGACFRIFSAIGNRSPFGPPGCSSHQIRRSSSAGPFQIGQLLGQLFLHRLKLHLRQGGRPRHPQLLQAARSTAPAPGVRLPPALSHPSHCIPSQQRSEAIHQIRRQLGRRERDQVAPHDAPPVTQHGARRDCSTPRSNREIRGHTGQQTTTPPRYGVDTDRKPRACWCSVQIGGGLHASPSAPAIIAHHWTQNPTK